MDVRARCNFTGWSIIAWKFKRLTKERVWKICLKLAAKRADTLEIVSRVLNFVK